MKFYGTFSYTRISSLVDVRMCLSIKYILTPKKIPKNCMYSLPEDGKLVIRNMSKTI